MQEIELKFHIPPASRAGVHKAVATATAQRTRLQAIYVDTEERHLARAGMALRLRKEGRRWVQTLKAGGAHAMQRFEHNMLLPAAAARDPRVDVQRHAGTPGEALLAKALAGLDPAVALIECYRTDIVRQHRTQRIAGGTVELAYDLGRISAADRRLPVCELEIELVRGTPQVVIEAARRWVQRHGLWLDVRTKAERGDRLSRGELVPPAVRGARSPLRRGVPALAAWRLGVADCLAQILPNASQIAAEAYGPEHVHQLRVGLRRLRSLLRFMRDWAPAPAPEQIAGLTGLFGELGGTRDRDALEASLLPLLEAAGAPRVDLPPDEAPAATAPLLREPATTLLWLAWLEATLEPAPAAPAPVAGTDPALEAASEPPAIPADVAAEAETPAAPAATPERLESLAARRLRRWHRQVVGQRKAFDSLDDAARHALRKRVKRLRYAAEFVAPLFPSKAVARHMKALRELQEQLGRFNDLSVATAAYQRLTGEDGRAWFALGWIAAHREAVLADCARALRDYARAEPFWS